MDVMVHVQVDAPAENVTANQMNWLIDASNVVTTVPGTGPYDGTWPTAATIAGVYPPTPLVSSAVDTAVVPTPTFWHRMSRSKCQGALVCATEAGLYVADVHSV